MHRETDPTGSLVHRCTKRMNEPRSRRIHAPDDSTDMAPGSDSPSVHRPARGPDESVAGCIRAAPDRARRAGSGREAPMETSRGRPSTPLAAAPARRAAAAPARDPRPPWHSACPGPRYERPSCRIPLPYGVDPLQRGAMIQDSPSTFPGPPPHGWPCRTPSSDPHFGCALTCRGNLPRAAARPFPCSQHRATEEAHQYP
ncbi:MAG: hypothetical protein QOH61_2767 [Chloroflexota bacterium]|jgi:hypothetical protein|nr:hypothetical protein [Chloroflexota bacterium]